jgi:demethylmenaquinone methyltransferase/2-methoxy-6-polyprenyl-1,4-benzoquinol methylase
LSNYNDLIDKKYKSIAYIPERLLSFTKKIRQEAIRYLNLKEGDKVIDVGCGTGASFPFLEEVIGKNGTILGVEPSSSMMKGAEERIKKENWKNITLIENKVEEIEVDSAFDGALLFAMHDVFNSMQGLEKIHSILKEGARVVCVGPKIQEKGFTRILNPFLHMLFKRMAISQENKDKPWCLIEKVFLTEWIVLEKQGLIFIYVGQKVNEIDGDLKL